MTSGDGLGLHNKSSRQGVTKGLRNYGTFSKYVYHQHERTYGTSVTRQEFRMYESVESEGGHRSAFGWLLPMHAFFC